MSQMFSPALLACITEARAPEFGELAELSEKIWVEAFGSSGEGRALADQMAKVALVGGDARCS